MNENANKWTNQTIKRVIVEIAAFLYLETLPFTLIVAFSPNSRSLGIHSMNGAFFAALICILPHR